MAMLNPTRQKRRMRAFMMLSTILERSTCPILTLRKCPTVMSVTVTMMVPSQMRGNLPLLDRQRL